jgi:hypothetical protein
MAFRSLGAGHGWSPDESAWGFTHLLVAVDKFTKWIEEKPITSLKSEQAVSFFQDTVHRFGFPNLIITDNGTTSQESHSWSFVTTTTSVLTGRRSRTPA